MSSRLIKIAIACALLVLTGCGSKRHAESTPAGDYKPAGNTSGTATPPFTEWQSDEMADALVKEAMKWIGTAYRYGGDSRRGTDCSGLVMSVYRDVCGIKLPRTTREQLAYCSRLKKGQEQAGDLIFFGSGKDPAQVSHVGICIGNGEMVHASSSRGVVVSTFTSGYWGERFRWSGRVDGAPLSWANVNGVKPSKGKKNKKSKQPKQPTLASQPPSTSTSPMPPSGTVVEMDLLDFIISQKTDSILNTLSPEP